jgi:Right handed beta helix region
MMKKRAQLTMSAFAFLLCSLFLLPMSSYSLEYFVSSSGDDSSSGASQSPWETIQYALDNTVSGDTITVQAGSYLLTAPILIDNSDSGKILKTDSYETISGGGSAAVFSINDLNGSFVIKGFKITDADRGIEFTNSSGCTVINSVITGCGSYGVYGQLSSPSIINCTISDNPGTGIYFSGDSFGFIKNSIVWSNGTCLGGEGVFDFHFSDIEDTSFFEINGNFSADPLFRGPNDYRLSAESPCIDEGDPSDSATYEPEPNWDRINVGAFGGTIEAAYNAEIYFEITQYAEVMPFKYPVVGPLNEHLMIADKIDGFSNYCSIYSSPSYTAYESRHYGVTPSSWEYLKNNHVEGTIKVVTFSEDALIKTTQIFRHFKGTRYFTITCIIENDTDTILNNVIYKRFADWDVNATFGGDNFSWDTDYNLVYAYEDSTYCGLASMTKPDKWDFHGWSDYESISTTENWRSYAAPPVSDDGLAIFHFDFQELKPGEKKEMFMLYCAGDSAAELVEEYEEARDSDNDGMIDPWEYLHFGDLSQGPCLDFDGDGLSNFEEHQLKTDPADSLTPVSMWVDDDNDLGPWLGTEANPFTSIQTAIDTYAGMHIVRVMPGTYYENILLNSDVYIAGVIRDETIVDGQGLGPVVGSDSVTDGKIEKLTLINGSNTYGGGIYLNDSAVIIKDCVITGNTALLGGGGIYWTNSARTGIFPPTIKNSVIKQNSVTQTGLGTGIAISGNSSTTLMNTIIDRNSALDTSSTGAALYISDSECTIANCDIVYNLSADSVGGIQATGVFSGKIINSIIWGNGTDIDGIGPGYFLNCNIENKGFPDANGNISQIPVFAYAPGGNYRLRRQSPCIDAGTYDTDSLPKCDIRFQQRILFGKQSLTPDIGAYEHRYINVVYSGVTDDYTLYFSAIQGMTYTILYTQDYSTDMQSWEAVAEVTADQTGIMTWVDNGLSGTLPPPSVAPRRFYAVYETQ